VSFFGGAEELGGGEEFPLGTGGEGEFVETEDGVAGTAAEVDHGRQYELNEEHGQLTYCLEE